MISKFTTLASIAALFGLAVVTGSEASAQQAATTIEQSITLDTGSGILYGSIVTPAGTSSPVPVVLLIAGSGPTDRNGNSKLLPGNNDSLKMVAENLAMSGIASLRYDKRGIGQSQSAVTQESALRFDTYVEDAAKWIDLLRKDPRFAIVVVAGHSEGSLIGMLASQQTRADGFISIAGPAQKASDVIRTQLAGKLPEALAQQNESILLTLERGATVEAIPAALPANLAQTYRASVQPYLISWFRYTPASEIVKLKFPVLILQGTTDIQVSTTDAQALKAARPDARLVLVDGMNHVLKMVPADMAEQLRSYSNPSLPVAEELTQAIKDFVVSLKPASTT